LSVQATQSADYVQYNTIQYSFNISGFKRTAQNSGNKIMK